MKSFLFFVLFLVAIYQVTCLDNSECLKNRQGNKVGDFLCDYSCATNGYYINEFKEDESFPGFPIFNTFTNQPPVTLNGMSSIQFKNYNDGGYISRNWERSDNIKYKDNADLLKNTPSVFDACPAFECSCERKRDTKDTRSDGNCYCPETACKIYNPSIFRIGSGNKFSAGNNGATGNSEQNPRVLKVWTEDQSIDASLLRWTVLTVQPERDVGEFCYYESTGDSGLNEVASYTPEMCGAEKKTRCATEYCNSNYFKPHLGAKSKNGPDCLCEEGETVLFTSKPIKYLVVGYSRDYDDCREREISDDRCDNVFSDVKIHYAWTPVGKQQSFGCTKPFDP